jgi:hypothetical protein
MLPSQAPFFGQLPSFGSDELAVATASLSLTTGLVLNDLTWASHNRLIPNLIGFLLLDKMSEPGGSLEPLLVPLHMLLCCEKAGHVVVPKVRSFHPGV